MWDIVRELVADGMSIFLTTQDLDEADQLADKITVLNRGRLVAEGTPEQLKRQIPGGHVELRFAGAAQLGAAVRVLPGSTPNEESLILRVPCDGGVQLLRNLLDRLDEYAIDVEEFTLQMPDRDDAFLALTGDSNVSAEPEMEAITK